MFLTLNRKSMHFKWTANIMPWNKVIASDCFQLVIKCLLCLRSFTIHCMEILFSVVKSGGDEIDDGKKWWGHVPTPQRK